MSYVGSQSYHLPAAVDMNTMPPVRCENPAGCLAGGILQDAQWNTVPQGTDYIPAGATRPNRFVGSTQTWMYLGNSSYHGGSVSLTKRGRATVTLRFTGTRGLAAQKRARSFTVRAG